MRRQDFHFDLPDELIAQRPTPDRQGSRLMLVGETAPHRITPFCEIVSQFRGDEILVVNDTRVVPARVKGKKETGGAVELLFVEPLGGGRIKGMLRGKKLRPGTRLIFPSGEAVVLEGDDRGVFSLQLVNVDNVWAWLESCGEIPLPPYIRRTADDVDESRYQTVYARKAGAVAAPTAGLHFTQEILDTLRAKGVDIHSVTLHVGLGTFLPMRADNVADHVMHTERYEVPEATREALASERPVVAVGTTVVRAIESFVRDPEKTATDIFITPGFDYQRVDGLLTNFHLPESTLLMLVSAFVGMDCIRDAYAQAVENRMRFFSYGDAMLLRRGDGRWT